MNEALLEHARILAQRDQLLTALKQARGYMVWASELSGRAYWTMKEGVGAIDDVIKAVENT